MTPSIIVRPAVEREKADRREDVFIDIRSGRVLSKEEIRAKIDRGIEQLERGKGIDGEKFFQELGRVSEERRRKRGKD